VGVAFWCVTKPTGPTQPGHPSVGRYSGDDDDDDDDEGRINFSPLVKS